MHQTEIEMDILYATYPSLAIVKSDQLKKTDDSHLDCGGLDDGGVDKPWDAVSGKKPALD